MCKEKYIYCVKDNLHRIKIIKKNLNIHYDKYFHCDLEEAIKILDEVLKNNDISLKEQVNEYKSILIEKYIYQTKNNKYRLFIKSGNYYYYSKTFDTLLEARKERKIRMSEKTLISNKKVKNDANLNEFVNIWFSIYCFKELKTTTSYSMMNILNKYVLKELGDEKISNITILRLQKYFSDLISKYTDISDKTIYRIYKVMKNMFNRAVDWEYISNNPIDKIKVRKPKSKETIIYSSEELIEILKLLKNEDIIFNVIFSIMITTGIRKCELLGLYVEDINFEKGSISINKNMNWNKFKHKYEIVSPKTSYSYRTIPVPKAVLHILEDYLLYRKTIAKKNINNLFINKKGYSMGFPYLTNSWHRFINKNNLKYITIHGLRHSYCTTQINNNKYLNISTVSKLMWHADIITTLKYLHSDECTNEKVCSVFED